VTSFQALRTAVVERVVIAEVEEVEVDEDEDKDGVMDVDVDVERCIRARKEILRPLSSLLALLHAVLAYTTPPPV
jgi:hypothetical protein